MADNNKEVKAKAPAKGEQTKIQAKAGVLGSFGEPRGFSMSPEATYNLYRKMRTNPTIALARMVATAPVRSANYQIEADEGVSEEAVKFIEREMKTLWPQLVKEMLLALDYGWSPFEKVWDVVDGMFIFAKLKSLKVEKTRIMIDRETGAFTGLKQGEVELSPEKCFVFTYDGEAGNFYGRSRHENVREHAWHTWTELEKRVGQYATKVAGITPMIEYPEGTSRGEDGKEVDNFDMAKKVLENLGKGNGVAMPNIFAKWAEELAHAGVDLKQLKAWQISFLEGKGNHFIGFDKAMRYNDSLMMRGWLVPERTVTEGQQGTKAEASSHGDWALVSATLLLKEVMQYINWYIINPMVVYNFGSEMENKIKMESTGLDAATVKFFREIVGKILSEGANLDLLLEAVDFNAMLDATGVPKENENIDVQDVLDKRSEHEEEVAAKAAEDERAAADKANADNTAADEKPPKKKAASRLSLIIKKMVSRYRSE